MFSPSRAFLPGTMASADFLRFVVTMLRFEFVYSLAPARPPRVSVITFTSYICCIYALNFGQYRTLFCRANSSISKRILCSFYCHACSGLSPPSYYACRAHMKKAPAPVDLGAALSDCCRFIPQFLRRVSRKALRLPVFTRVSMFISLYRPDPEPQPQ